MSRSIRAAVGVFTAVALGQMAGATTIATFADPSTGPGTPLFTFNGTGGGPGSSLSGSWLNNGLLLQTPGTPSPDFPNAHFTMAPVVVTGVSGPSYSLGPGSIVFTDNGGTMQLTISFTSATRVRA